MDSPTHDSLSDDLDDWLDCMDIEPGSVGAHIEETRQRIGRLTRMFGQILDEVAAAHGISTGDWEALSVLARHRGPCTPTQLASTLALTSGTVSTRLRRLAQAGLIETLPASDGRSRPIALTEEGRRAWRAATRDRVAVEREMFDGLDPQRLGALNTDLSMVLGRLEQRYGSAPRHDRVN